MAHYVHHIPGRLRVKSVWLKRNEKRAQQVRELLHGIEGVLGAETNTVTGSLLISYDKERTCTDELLQTLKRSGCCADSTALPLAGTSTPQRFAGAGEAVGKAVFGVLVEKVVERSALALIGAVL